jgi:hypothetical protein
MTFSGTHLAQKKDDTKSSIQATFKFVLSELKTVSILFIKQYLTQN